jgi:glutamate 5-kinase
MSLIDSTRDSNSAPTFDTEQFDFIQSPQAEKPRIVVKVGSSLLANTPELRPRYAFMHGLLSDIAALRKRGYEVVLASSGSVALGLNALRTDGESAGVQEKQAAAACGQPVLLNAYKQVALEHGFDIAQVLVTLEDMEDSRRFLNTKNTVHKLLELGLLPIVNENDTVTTEEIRVGDNDRLAAKVAQMIQAQHLVILTSVDGLYDRNPEEEGARLVDEVEDVSEYLEVTSGTSALGSGGMLTKDAGRKHGAERRLRDDYFPGRDSTRPLPRRSRAGVRARAVSPNPRRSRPGTSGSRIACRWRAASCCRSRPLTRSRAATRHSAATTSCRSTRQFQKADVLHVYDERGGTWPVVCRTSHPRRPL